MPFIDPQHDDAVGTIELKIKKVITDWFSSYNPTNQTVSGCAGNIALFLYEDGDLSVKPGED